TYFQRTNDVFYLEAATKQAKFAEPLMQKFRAESTSEEADPFIMDLFEQVYQSALRASIELWQQQPLPRHFDLVFYFAERLKHKTLLESVRSIDNYQIANIPETTLRREYQIKKDIQYYRSILEEPENEQQSHDARAKLKQLFQEQ